MPYPAGRPAPGVRREMGPKGWFRAASTPRGPRAAPRRASSRQAIAASDRAWAPAGVAGSASPSAHSPSTRTTATPGRRQQQARGRPRRRRARGTEPVPARRGEHGPQGRVAEQGAGGEVRIGATWSVACLRVHRAAHPHRSPEWLTEQERDVLAGLGAGLSDAEIGSRPHPVEGTVRGHVSAVLAALGARDRVPSPPTPPASSRTLPADRPGAREPGPEVTSPHPSASGYGALPADRPGGRGDFRRRGTSPPTRGRARRGAASGGGPGVAGRARPPGEPGGPTPG